MAGGRGHTVSAEPGRHAARFLFMKLSRWLGMGARRRGTEGGGANGNVKVDLIQLQRFGSHKMNQNRGSTCVFDCVVVHTYYIYIYYNIFLSEY